ncbi:hypothetical protein KIN20_006177 [Parelaphostrongylus tenuis]|uniref:Uncharacterized protein n=1 Tax=Parelaphostrongylus tenuis TaxID=148309 RepID=A0AAD5QJ59_PARTN|nr:hypothetical protein KIN20_006177 [Parelaphostrongylus tenuis]
MTDILLCMTLNGPVPGREALESRIKSQTLELSACKRRYPGGLVTKRHSTVLLLRTRRLNARNTRTTKKYDGDEMKHLEHKSETSTQITFNVHGV